MHNNTPNIPVSTSEHSERDNIIVEAYDTRLNGETQDNFSIPGLEWDGSDDYLMVEGGKCSSDEWSHPEDPLKHNKTSQV